MTRPLIYLIAGEPSGDILAARLMRALREIEPVDFAGIGGEAMRAEGLISLFPQADLAVMGFAEVVPRIPRILARLHQTLDDIAARQPDLIVTIDSWGFTGRVAKRLQAKGSTIPRLHYVAPMVWAWKEQRARQLAERVDRLLCLLPNEPAFFSRHGLAAVHVGHPVLERDGEQADGAGFRCKYDLPSDAPLLCVLPGSRQSETSRLLPVFEATADLLAQRIPGLRVVIPSVETVAADVRRAAAGWRVPAVVVAPADKWDCFAASRAALAASGTVALELAVARLPMVIGYRVAPATAYLVRRLLTVKFVSLINLTLDRLVVPEYLQEHCTAETLFPAMLALFTDETARQRQLAGCIEALDRLGVPGETPSRRAAFEALSMIKDRKK